MNFSKEIKKTVMRGALAILSLSQLGVASHESSYSTFGALRFQAQGLCSHDGRELGFQISFADEASKNRAIVIYASDETNYGLSAVAYAANAEHPTAFHYFQKYFIGQDNKMHPYKGGQTYSLNAYSVGSDIAKKLESQIDKAILPLPDTAVLVAKTEAQINCRPPLSEIAS